MDMLQQINETAAYIRERVQNLPRIGVILGSGLGNLSDLIDVEVEMKYADIPHMPVSTVQGHSGRLLFGKLAGREVVAMAGRFHYYEGYDMKQVTFPVRVMKAIGVETIFVSNAAGGMNKEFKVGDVMVITDHINLFPAMTHAYDPALLSLADDIAAEQQIRLMHGVYVGTPGPTFETPAEYEYFRVIGGDAVGMSTVPEVIVANHAGMRCFGLSVITDLGGKDIEQVPTHEEVQQAAVKASPVMARLVSNMIGRL